MDAIFEYPVDYLYDSIRVFNSYMERASLQFNIELGEYVESAFGYNSSSSFVILEASKEGLIEKTKKAIKMLIEKVKRFMADTKKNIIKYVVDKKIEKTVKSIERVCKKNKLLQKVKINRKDFSAKRNFIKREKETIKKLFSKPTKSDEIKYKITEIKDKLKKSELVKSCATPVMVYASMSFFEGLVEGLTESERDINKEAEESLRIGREELEKLRKATEQQWEDIRKMRNGNYNEDAKDIINDINEEQAMIKELMNAFTILTTEEIALIREEMMEYTNTITAIGKSKLFYAPENLDDESYQDTTRVNQEFLQQQLQMSNSMFFI